MKHGLHYVQLPLCGITICTITITQYYYVALLASQQPLACITLCEHTLSTQPVWHWRAYTKGLACTSFQKTPIETS